MSCIFEVPLGAYLHPIHFLVQIDTPIATHYRSTRRADGNELVLPQRLRMSYHSYFPRTQYSGLRSLLHGQSDILTLRNLAVPAFFAGKVDFIPDPFLYNASRFKLSKPRASLNLEGRGPFDNDESPDRPPSRHYNSNHTKDVENRRAWCNNHDLPPSANTRSHRRQGSDGGRSPPRGTQPEGRCFRPYAPRKSTVEINNIIKGLLLRQHADAGEGYVYGFHNPDDTRIDQPILAGHHNGRSNPIKIGRSKNHHARMKQISKKCGYTPNTVFVHPTPQQAMVERVVHTQLHNSRLRDVGCVGCGTRHEEWFDVDARRAEHLVALWKAFAECQPYDKHGEILPTWRERLEQVDLSDPDCWEDLVHGVSLARSVAGSPQALQAEAAPTSLAGGLTCPSANGNSSMDAEDED